MSVQYTDFQDDAVTLPNARGDIDKEVDFATPDVKANKNGVLTFEANPSEGNPTLELSINGHRVYSRTYFSSVERVVQEHFPQSILQTDNTLRIRVTGEGSVTTSDFLVLYKAN